MGGMGEGNALSRAVAAERTVVVFDFDGTLADTMGGIVEVASGVLRDFGLDEECLADCPKLVGPPFPEAFSEVWARSLRLSLIFCTWLASWAGSMSRLAMETIRLVMVSI